MRLLLQFWPVCARVSRHVVSTTWTSQFFPLSRAGARHGRQRLLLLLTTAASDPSTDKKCASRGPCAGQSSSSLVRDLYLALASSLGAEGAEVPCLSSFWSRLGVLLGRLEGFLDRLRLSWAVLGLSWRPLETFWGDLGGLWGRLGVSKSKKRRERQHLSTTF